MSYFYGGISGNRGPATRMGSKESGIDGYVQSHDARLQVQMTSFGDEDRAHFTLEGGYSNYNAGRLTLTFPHVNDVVNALSKGDPKIEAIVERIQTDIKKLNDEAAAALKRIERRQKIEANKRNREQAAKQARLDVIRETITTTERENYIRLVMGIEDDADRQRWGYDKPERIDQSILAGYGDIEPYRDDHNHLIIWYGDGWQTVKFDLTDGIEFKEEEAA